jgi:hypothetical protein
MIVWTKKIPNNFYRGMLLQEFYRVFGAANLFSEDIRENSHVVKYFFYYMEKKQGTFIFTFKFRRPEENDKFSLQEVRRTPFNRFYKYENFRHSNQSILSSDAMIL